MGFLVIIYISCVASCVFTAPGRRGGFGARPTFWIAGRKCNAGQNKLRSELLAGGGKLCTHNLLMVCKLRAEFAPSSILHLSLPFFSLHALLPLWRLSPFSPHRFLIFFPWKSCKESRLLNPWIYEAVRVSSAHVNLSQYLHLGFTAEGKIKTGPQHFSNPIPVSSSG